MEHNPVLKEVDRKTFRAYVRSLFYELNYREEVGTVPGVSWVETYLGESCVAIAEYRNDGRGEPVRVTYRMKED